jgi:hypothetical protein
MAEAIPGFDLCGELHVDMGAPPEVIEASWRTLMKNHHPDVGDGGSVARAVRLNVAHDWLGDPARRGRYDAALRSALPGSPSAAPPPVRDTSPDPAPGTANASPAHATQRPVPLAWILGSGIVALVCGWALVLSVVGFYLGYPAEPVRLVLVGVPFAVGAWIASRGTWGRLRQPDTTTFGSSNGK